MPKLNTLECRQAFQILQQLCEAELPVSGSLKVRKLLRTIAEHLDDVEQTRLAKIKQHAELDDEGQVKVGEGGEVIFKSQEDEAAFRAEFEELMLLDTELPVSLTEADLGMTLPVEKQAQIKPRDLLLLGDLLE